MTFEQADVWPAHPFDAAADGDDKLREKCGVFGVFGVPDAARYVALGLHALQHRGQEAAGVVAYDPDSGHFGEVRRLGLVRDHFTKPETLSRLPGPSAVGHTRYATAGQRGATEMRDVQPLFAELADGGLALAHNGNLTNAESLRDRLVGRGSIFQSSADTECIVHLMASAPARGVVERLTSALAEVEGAYSLALLTQDALVGVRDPRGVRPLSIGRLNDGWVLASETCALDIVGATFVREVAPGEIVVLDADGLRSERPFQTAEERPCIFEYVYFSRPDSVMAGRSVHDVRRRIGEILAEEAPVDADIVSPVPDSGLTAATGYAAASGAPLAFAIIKNQYVGRTFIEPTEQIRNMKVRLKLNVNRSVVRGRRVVLVDDSIVRGHTARAIGEMLKEAGASEVHFRVASPPTKFPCFYGVDTPDQNRLIAASLDLEEMRALINVDSLAFLSLDGLHRAVHDVAAADGGDAPRTRGFCDACFSGAYPVAPRDALADGRLKLAAE